MKRAISLILTAAMVMSFLCTGTFAVSFVDVEDHWAEEAIERWTSNGVVNGKGENRFDPDATLTRAEMAQIYVNLLNLTEKADISTYTDVPADAWYADAVAKCVAAGVLTGTGSGTFSPLRPITREQMFVAFGRAMGLKPSETTSSDLSDLGDVSDWAEGMVNALLNAGYVSGVDGSSLLPLKDINRASVMALLDKTVAAYGNTPGATVETEGDGGLVLVVTDDVTVTGTVADVVVAQGAADSVVTLSDATVTGTVTMAAAGARLAVMGESEVENVVVNPSAQGAGVSVGQDAMVASVVTEATDTDLSVSGTVGDVTVAETASDTTVSTEKGAKVESVTTAGADTTMSVAGTVGSVTVTESATGATVSTEKGAKVESVTTAGSGTTVEGSGTVSKVEAAEGATDTSVTTSGTKVENNSSESVTTDKGTVAAGESGTTSGGSTSSGGSSSSGGGSSHSHSYVDGVCSCGGYDPAWAQVNSVETWNAAVEAGKNIVVTADFTANAQLKITKGMTVNGNGKTITAGEWTDSNPTSKGDMPLVSVSAGSNAVVIKNITLTGAKNIVTGTDETATTDYGHGLNVYESSNVTLNNVTLSGNAAAGLVVNSSTVNATGLHTSGNTWGGVNVDKNSGENAPAAFFTFDNTSTFSESVAVYSDGGSVTVKGPGYACVPVTNNEKTVYIWSKLFNGGFGTEESPYEIATAEQLLNMDKLSSQMAGTVEYTYYNDKNSSQDGAKSTSYIFTPGKSYNFKLVKDIDLRTVEIDGPTALCTYFYGTFDGAGKKIISPDDTYAFLFGYVPGTSTIKNINLYQCGGTTSETESSFLQLIYMGGAGDYDEAVVKDSNNNALIGTKKEASGCSNTLASSGYAADITISDINVYNYTDDVTYTTYWQNSGSFCQFAWGNSFTMQNIDNYASFRVKAGTWSGVFLNGYTTTTLNALTFTNCNNYGDVSGQNVALFVGNSNTAIANDKITITNCHNFGKLVGTQRAAYFSTIHDSYGTINETCNTLNINQGGGAITLLSAQGLALTVGDDGKLNITACRGAASYQIVIMAQYPITNGSSSVVILSEKLTDTDTTIVYGEIMDSETASKQNITVNSYPYTSYNSDRPNYAIATVGNTNYYVFNSEALETGAVLNSTGNYSVIAYDKSGNMIGQANLIAP